jgi:hypothetical protein
VQVAPELYLLFWGSNFWNNFTEPIALYDELHFFYESLGGEIQFPYTEGWQGILTQYVNAQGAYKDARIAGESHVNAITAPKNLTNAMVENEASEYIRELKAKGTPPGPNSEIVVLTAPETTIAETAGCGYHSVLGYEGGEYSYTFVPYAGDATKYYEKHGGGTCNYLESNSKVKGTTAQMMFSTTGVASHEFAESVTDPELGDEIAWQGEQKNGEVEIADLCEDEAEPIQELPDTEGRLGWTYVFKLWDDEGGDKCKLEDPPYPAPSAPSVTSEAVTGLAYHQAILNGNVNPNGPAAKYDFEWGPKSSSENKTPEGNISYGETAVKESAAITGLKAGTAYYYRVHASNWVGGTTSSELKFSTPIPPPVVKTESSSELGDAHVTLNGSVNPEEFSTKYQFEYWEAGKSSEVSKIPVTAESVGAGTTSVKVSQKLSGLASFTEYVYRITATSAGGTSRGAEMTFTTGPFMATQTAPAPSGAKESLLIGVSCLSTSSCTTVGHYKNSTGTNLMLGERWNGIEWQIQTMPAPSGAKESYLSGVSCSSTTACTAVGQYVNSSGVPVTLAERWNGTEWLVQSTPNPSGEQKGANLAGVSCVTSSACTAVGYYENSAGTILTIAEVWNGTEWKMQTSRNDAGAINMLESVSCVTSTACTAAGTVYGETLVERWNGTEWTIQKSANGAIGNNSTEGIFCSTTTTCTAVGYYRSGLSEPRYTLAEGWNGTEWVLQTTPNPVGAKTSLISQVSCWSSTACDATGSYENSGGGTVPLAEGVNGTQWKVHATTIPSGAKASSLAGISCTAVNSCTAVGQYVNSSGTTVPLVEAIGPPAIKAEAASGVTGSGATLNGTLSPDGWETTYHFEYGPTVSYGTTVPIPNASAGSETTPEKVTYTIGALHSETTYHYRLVATSSGGTTYGEDHTFTTARAWSVVPTPNPSGATESSLESVSCFSATACSAAGSDKNSAGTRVTLGERWNGSEWQLQATPNPSGAKESYLRAISCPSATACTTVGQYVNSAGLAVTLAERWNGTEWTIQSTPNPAEHKGANLTGISCASITACTAVGYYETSTGLVHTLAESWNGTEWKIQTTPNESGFLNMLDSVSCTASTACTASGGTYGSALVEHWNGTEWLIQKSINGRTGTNNIEGVSCATATACTGVGYDTEGSAEQKFDLAEGWNGSEWTLQTIPNPTGAKTSALSAIACWTATACAGVGSYESSAGVNTPLTMGWSGTEWKIQTAAIPTGAKASYLHGVSCPATNSCTAVGHYVNSSGTTVSLAEESGPPISVTEAATSITNTSATLNSSITPDGAETSYHFEYGTTTSYGTKVPVPDARLGSEIAAEKVARAISGLAASTTYHYRVVASNPAGTTDGEDHTFTTG